MKPHAHPRYSHDCKPKWRLHATFHNQIILSYVWEECGFFNSCSGLTLANNYLPASFPPSPCQQDGVNWKKVKSIGWDKSSLKSKIKMVIVLIMTMVKRKIRTGTWIIAKRNKQSTIPLVTTCSLMASMPLSSNWSSQPASPGLYPRHNVLWYGRSLWSVWVSCSQLCTLSASCAPAPWLSMGNWKVLHLG